MKRINPINKKAQVSIEVLTILTILVLGAILFGVYYLNLTRKNIEIANKFDIGPELYIEDGPVGGGSTPPDHPIIVPGQLTINAIIGPDPILIYEDFNITTQIASLPNGLDNNSVVITSISAFYADGSSTGDCNYSSQPIIGAGLIVAPIDIGNTINNTTSVGPFSCSTDGNYQFVIHAEMSASFELYSEPATDPKQIKSFVLDLSATGESVVNMNFNIRAKVSDYLNNKTIVIKNIKVDQNNVCDYNGVSLTTTGLDTNYLMSTVTGSSSNYDLNLNLFNCSAARQYNFTISAGEYGSNDLNKNDDTNITKVITDGFSRQLILTLDNYNNSLLMPTFEFEVLANVNYYSGFDNIVIKEINAYKRNTIDGVYTRTSDCSYNNQLISSGLGYTDLIPFLLPDNPDSQDYNLLLPFYCCNPGFYKFEVKAGIKESSNPSENDDDDTTQEQGCLYIGTGTFANPKQIENPEDLFCVRYYLDSNFIVNNNIDLLHKELSDNPAYYWYDDIKGWNGIGNRLQYNCSSGDFSGNFNGNNYTIANLFDYRPFDETYPYPQGIFASTSLSAKIQNLTISDANVFVESFGGALVGVNGGIIENCKVDNAAIGGYSNLGGLAGRNAEFGQINLCSSNATVINDSLHPYEGDGYENAGMIGGLVGTNGGIITQSYATGNVSGMQAVGGLVGLNRYIAGGSQTIIENSYSKAAVSCATDSGIAIGGLVGRLSYIQTGLVTNTMIKDSYSVGEVSGSGEFIGGLIGFINMNNNISTDLKLIVRNSLWDKESSGQETSCQECSAGAGNTPPLCNTGVLDYNYFGWGETTADMKIIDTFNTSRESINYGFVFVPWSISVSDPYKIWGITSEVNDGYPHLRANPPPEGE